MARVKSGIPIVSELTEGETEYRSISGQGLVSYTKYDNRIYSSKMNASVIPPVIDKQTSSEITNTVINMGPTGELELDLSALTASAVAHGDEFIFLDTTSSSAARREAVHDLATLFAGAGMTATSSVLNVIGGTGITANANEITTTDGEIVHNNLSGHVPDEHIAHGDVTLTAGAGLSGGGTIAASRTFAVDISEFSDVQIASGDKLLVLDSDGATEQLESIDDIATLFAGAGLAASSAVLSVDIDELSALGGTGLHQTQDHFMFSDNGTEKKITFSNLEDAIFGNVNGDIAIAAGGEATIQPNSVALGTDTTGNYVATLTAGALIDLQNNSGETASPTVDVDLTEATEAVMANGDYVLFLDGGATGTHAKEAIADVATLFAGAGLTATNSVIALDINDLTAEVIATGDTIAFNDSDDNGIHVESVDDLFTIGPALVAEDAVAQGTDYMLFLDGGSTGDMNKESIPDFIDAINGTGLDAGSGLLSVSAAQTTITSIINSGMTTIGTAADQEYIKFDTSNEINTIINNTERLSVTATGVDVTGAMTVSTSVDITGSAGLILENDETITNSSDGYIALSGNLVIPNAGTIGSASDKDAMSISSAGLVNISQTATVGTSTAAGEMSDLLSPAQKTFFADLLDDNDDVFDFGGNNADGNTTLIDTGDDPDHGFSASNAAFIHDSGSGLITNSASAQGALYLLLTTVVDKIYEVNFDVIAGADSDVEVCLSSSTSWNTAAESGARSAGTTHSLVHNYVADDTSTYLIIRLISSTSGHEGRIDNLLVREAAKFSGAEIGSASFVSGFAGAGWKIDKDATADNEFDFTVDNMSIRGRLSVYELLIQQIRATNGSVFISSAAKVDSTSGLSATDAVGDITFEDPSGHGICPFAVNDLIMMQRVVPGSLVAGNSTAGSTDVIKKLVYKVTAISGATATVTGLPGGTDIGFTNNTFPSKGDDFVRIGNTGSSSRQGIIYLTSDDSNAPYIDIKSGVSSYALWHATSTTKVRLGNLAGITDSAMNGGSELSGYGLYATGNVHIKGALVAGSLANAGTTATTNQGFYADSDGNLLLKGDDNDTNYIKFDADAGNGALQIKTGNFSVDSSGDCTMAGTVTASAGAVANWNIVSNNIYNLGSSSTPTSSPQDGIVLSTNLGITNNKPVINVYDGTTINAALGNFAEDKFGIYAIEGAIGGWDIGSNYIKNNATNGAIWAGVSNADSGQSEIRISSDGAGTGTSNYVRMYIDHDVDTWGIEGVSNASGSAVTVFHLGETTGTDDNQIAGWSFTNNTLYKTDTTTIGITTAGHADSPAGANPQFFAGASGGNASLGGDAQIAFANNGKIYGNGVYVKNSVDYLITASRLFGNGSDGDVIMSSMATLTLSRDMYYDDFTMQGSNTITANGYRIFVRGTFTIGGAGCKIQNNGVAGANGSDGESDQSGGAGGTGAGGGAAEGSLRGGVNGGRGGAGGNGGSSGTGPTEGSDGTSSSQSNVVKAYTNSAGARGGDGQSSGGDGADGASASSGTEGKISMINSDLTFIIAMRDIFAVGDSAPSLYPATGAGGGGGGGGGGHTTGNGDGGGGGGQGGGSGGHVMLVAKFISGTQSNLELEAKGGNGGNGGRDSSTGVADGGRGAGGNGGDGGCVTVISGTDPDGITIDVAGGTAGSNGSAGSIANIGTPAAGTTGTSIVIHC